MSDFDPVIMLLIYNNCFEFTNFGPPKKKRQNQIDTNLAHPIMNDVRFF